MDVKQYPVFITCRDKVTSLISLISWLEKIGQTNIYLLDNKSTFPPLLDFYKETQYKVFYLDQNLGGRALWWSGLIDMLRIEDRFIVSDSDVIPVEGCPHDVIEVFDNVLNEFPEYKKVGFGLKFDDLPDHYKHKQDVIAWEGKFYTKEISPGLYDAPIDTTFALYQPGSEFGRTPGIRTGHPYLARHVPWYTDMENLSDEDVFFRNNLPSTHTTNWNQYELRGWLSNALGKTSKTGPAKSQPSGTVGAAPRTADYPMLAEELWAQRLARDAGKVESTQRFWKTIIEPVIEILQPETVVEIGSDTGGYTRNALEFCRRSDAELHVVDPAPKSNISAWKDQYGDRLIVHKDLGLSNLPLGDKLDVVLVNGDRDWYRVFDELKLIERRYRETNRLFPLTMLHDIRRSYGQRNLYYEADRYRSADGREDTLPESMRLSDRDSVNPRLHKASYEDDSQDGVLAAIRDFVDETGRQFELLEIPGLYGFGILIPPGLKEQNTALAEFFDILDLPKTVTQLVEQAEDGRIDALARLSEANRQLQESNKRQRQLSGQKKQLREANKKLRELRNEKKQLRQTNNRLREANKRLRQSPNEAKKEQKQNGQIRRAARKINVAARKLRSILGNSG